MKILTLSLAMLMAAPLSHLAAEEASKPADAALVTYDFANAEDPAAPTTVAPGIEASQLTFGQTIADAFAKSPPAATFTPEGALSIRSDVLPKGVGAEGEHYLSFTLKVPKGKRFAVTGISLAARRSSNAPDLYVYPRIKSSFDDYNTVISVGQIKSTDPVRLEQKINGLQGEGEVTFRLYLPAINLGTNRVIVDEISLSGNVISQ